MMEFKNYVCTHNARTHATLAVSQVCNAGISNNFLQFHYFCQGRQVCDFALEYVLFLPTECLSVNTEVRLSHGYINLFHQCVSCFHSFMFSFIHHYIMVNGIKNKYIISIRPIIRARRYFGCFFVMLMMFASKIIFLFVRACFTFCSFTFRYVRTF